MTDAALTVTQSRVEEFTESYLRACGYTIDKQGSRWVVTTPAHAGSSLITEECTLVCGPDKEVAEEELALHPKSEFFDALLAEAAERTPIGKIPLTQQTMGVSPPAWIRDGSNIVKKLSFTPYYDRSALFVLFRMSIETVSEYEQSVLRGVAIDARTGNSLSGLASTCVEYTDLDGESDATSTSPTMSRDDVDSLLNEARTELVEQSQGLIDDVHEEASRAADAEVEEYRQMQQQRLEELQDRRSQLSARLDELEAALGNDDQAERMEVLKERKEVRGEYQQVEDDIADVRGRRERGFPEQQASIRDRHALTVRNTPLSITEVEYERGDLDLELGDGSEVDTMTLGYGIGVGVTEMVRCSSCGCELTEETPIASIDSGPVCATCTES